MQFKIRGEEDKYISTTRTYTTTATQGTSHSCKLCCYKKGVMKTVDPLWILLENQSTEDVFSNSRLVHNIRHTQGQYITIHYNVGKFHIMKEDTLKGYRKVCVFH